MQIIEKLNNEDLSRWRIACAKKDLIDNSYPGMSITEAQNVMIDYYRLLGELIADYKVPVEDGPVIIPPSTGYILRLDPND